MASKIKLLFFSLCIVNSISSCIYKSTLFSNEGYEYNHVYVTKKMGIELSSHICPVWQAPLEYIQEDIDFYFQDFEFPEDIFSNDYSECLNMYEAILSQGYYERVYSKADLQKIRQHKTMGGFKSNKQDDEQKKEIRFGLPPGSLFRIKYLYYHCENGSEIYAEVLNGPLAGCDVCVNDFGRLFFSKYSKIDFSNGLTDPIWQNNFLKSDLEITLDKDAIEDLGVLTDAELKEKGLWIEPFTEEARALLKPLPEGIDLGQLQKDAENNDIAAQIQLSKLYYEGAGVRKSRNEAIGWLQKAADQGSRDAEYRLALVLADPRRGANFRKAEEIFRKYAEHGYKDAQFCLGLLLERGYEREAAVWPKWKRDKDRMGKWRESVDWYRKAAEQGDARAMRALGMAYYEGERVEQDYGKAAEWSKKAAELGDFAAQRNLGYLYLKGKGVKKDKAEARKWLEKAAAQGDSYAQELLAESFPN